MTKSENLYVLSHTHKHGTDFYLFKSFRNMQDLPGMDALSFILGIDYDKNEDDWDIHAVGFNEIINIETHVPENINARKLQP